ncbi:MAG: DUF2339 domain-containing protein, partial [Casimicrobiaceae bacterium]
MTRGGRDALHRISGGGIVGRRIRFACGADIRMERAGRDHRLRHRDVRSRAIRRKGSGDRHDGDWRQCAHRVARTAARCRRIRAATRRAAGIRSGRELATAPTAAGAAGARADRARRRKHPARGRRRSHEPYRSDAHGRHRRRRRRRRVAVACGRNRRSPRARQPGSASAHAKPCLGVAHRRQHAGARGYRGAADRGRISAQVRVGTRSRADRSTHQHRGTRRHRAADARGFARYHDADFATTEPFLVLFFLFYVGIAVLYAVRRSQTPQRYVDGTLVFGTPLVAAGLQQALMRPFEFGMAISAIAAAALYLSLARALWARRGDGLRLLVESLLALGIVCATLAVPLAFGARLTSAAWAIEGAAITWIGIRQRRGAARAFGILLQVAAGIAYAFGDVFG